MNKLFVFDLDNTLIDTTHNYDKSIVDAAMHIVTTLGNNAPHVFKIIEMIMSADQDMAFHPNPTTGKSYGYSMERFPSALRETYRDICRHSKIVPNHEIEQEIYDIGMAAFDARRYYENIRPHAVELIQFLKRQYDFVVLCTKGDERVQRNKIIALIHAGLKSIDEFNGIYVVPDKTSKVFRSIKEKYRDTVESCNTYSVSSNSFKSDIEPALKSGYNYFKGILIPLETWDNRGWLAEDLSLARISGTHIFNSLRDIEYNYDKL